MRVWSAGPMALLVEGVCGAGHGASSSESLAYGCTSNAPTSHRSVRFGLAQDGAVVVEDHNA